MRAVIVIVSEFDGLCDKPYVVAIETPAQYGFYLSFCLCRRLILLRRFLPKRLPALSWIRARGRKKGSFDTHLGCAQPAVEPLAEGRVWLVSQSQPGHLYYRSSQRPGRAVLSITSRASQKQAIRGAW